MKSLLFLMLPATLALVACETLNAPLNSASSFDPLRPPGTGLQSSSQPDNSVKPGQFVTASIPNTAFYKDKPKNNADADKLLDVGTAMKVVSVDSTFIKVELDSGETGYVPSVMINTGAEEPPAYLPGDGIFPVYPPLPDGSTIEPLPIIDPSGLPPGDAIPAIIDPDAPIPEPLAPLTLDPVPDLKETPAPALAEPPSLPDPSALPGPSALPDPSAPAKEKITEAIKETTEKAAAE